MIRREYNVFTMCSGLGGGAKGFQEAVSTVGTKTATWRCIGGIDNDAAACRDFKSLVGVDCTLMDLFTREQYTAFHGAEPPAGWREATPDDIRRAAGNEHPHCVFISSPCKGASGLLSESLSRTPKYQALNELTLRCVWLMCEAWKDDPVELIVFENVPRLMTRARHLLDQIGQIFYHYGYAKNETTHDCGEIGELAQSRKRFLMVSRHAEKVPAFLYEPPIKRLQGVGTVLGRMPLPGDQRGGAMHRIPSLQWKTWVRLAFVEAGSDWRSLNKLAVQNGHLRDFLVVPERRGGHLGVVDWSEPAGTVAGESLPTNGAFSVADPRAPADALHYRNFGVVQWEDSSGAIIGVKSPGQGMFSVADPRTRPSTRWNHGQNYGVVPWNDPSGTISGQQWPNQGRFAVADPRHTGTPKHNNEFRIVPWGEASGAVTGAHGTGQCVQDPRPPAGPLFSKYKVTDWSRHAGTVIGGDDQGAYAVADPRAAPQFDGSRATASMREAVMSNEKIIPYDQPDLVKRVTVTGWVSTDGRFYGENEDLARYASCTHVRCACGALAEKPWTACDDCRVKNDIERYNKMPKREWDGSTMLYSDAADRYFQDYEEIVDYLRDRADDDPPITVDGLHLVICEPNRPRYIDSDYFSDEMAEDDDYLPKAIQEAMEAFNSVMEKQPPLSWSPGKHAAIVMIDPKDLA